MATVTAPVEERIGIPEGQRFVLSGVDWVTYRKVSDAFTGRHLRFTYDRGRLEFMTISSTHGGFSRLIGRLIVTLTEELGMPVRSCGDMTCDREDLDRGVEPYECFYLVNEPLVRTKKVIDLTEDPPPDLAVEIDVSRNSRRRLGIYEALRVPEVWRFDGETLEIRQLGDDGKYTVAQHSRYFPFVSGLDLVRFLQQHTEMDENALVRSFRAWVQEQIQKGA